MSAGVLVDKPTTGHSHHGLSSNPHHGGGNPSSRSSMIHRDESELWEHDSDFSDDSHTTTSSENYDYSLEDIISYIGLGRYQWFVMILAGVVWFSAAIQLMCTSILLLNLKDVDASSTISTEEEAVIAAIPFAGEIIGSISMSIFSDKYGRKKAILIAALCLSFFGTLSAISYDFYMLVICRFMCGFAVGSSLNCLSLVTEFIPQKHRGEMSYVEVSFWSLGAIYAIAIGMQLMEGMQSVKVLNLHIFKFFKFLYFRSDHDICSENESESVSQSVYAADNIYDIGNVINLNEKIHCKTY